MCAGPSIDALRSKAPEISKILQQGESLLDPTLEVHFPELYSNVILPDVRVLRLKTNLDRINRVLRLSKPSVAAMEDVLCKLEALKARISESREKLQRVAISTQIAHLRQLEEEIKGCEKKLNSVNRLVDRLDPKITSIDTGDDTQLESLLESAEKMVESKQFCDSLNSIQSLDTSDLVKEVSERIETSLDRICELSLLWLQKETYRLYNTEDSIIQPFIICNNSSVESLFEMDATRNSDSVSSGTEQGGVHASAVRILSVLRTRQKYFGIFMDNIKDLLTHLSQRRFNNLLIYAGKDMYDIFMNLQLILTMIKSSVTALYKNAKLESEDPVILINAISQQLLGTLESKLDQQIPETFEGALELFRNIQICHFYRDKLESVLKEEDASSEKSRNPILAFLDETCNDWRKNFHVLVENIQKEMGGPETGAPVMSLFLHKLIDIQLEFTESRDLHSILEKINALTLCTTLSTTYQIFKPLQSSIVPQQFKNAIKERLDAQIQEEYTIASEAILNELNITKNNQEYTCSDESVSNRISSIIYSESLESFEVLHNVSLLPDPVKRLILQKLYLLLVDVYKNLNGDSTKVKEMTDMVNGFPHSL
ncbi:hypothetical protein BEWA_009050 [Theileria equi strain WA]|uniref:Uncharacterized protein n=1 Tax=Theileria equi strain WA TaxID=1537102 RepID=L0B1Y6_THEEQ|nr:hypothetical protein BEWA_009050 [Theileria equi strain WA]AFZ81493.1 hypothetical protein BEWA_009050 [Theileria equi strain WA]|eukprot:XP_004831159.1 hypothetical protein BEWA_009050 [Theileria equi strain WA]